VICTFDDDFFNNLLHPVGNNLWPTHPTNCKYKIWLLKQSNYLLGFVSLSKHSLKIIINKKWLENERNSKEDKYESPTFVYYKETNVMVVATPLWGKCEDETHTPKCGKLESSEFPKNSDLDCRGQISSYSSVIYVIRKVLKCRCLKWPRMSHLQPKLWAKEGPRIKLPVWLPTTKSQESTSSRHQQE
jgi:hypothetical protein